MGAFKATNWNFVARSWYSLKAKIGLFRITNWSLEARAWDSLKAKNWSF